MRILLLLLAILVTACGASRGACDDCGEEMLRLEPGGHRFTADTRLQPLVWWLGHWRGADGAEEHWVAAGTAIMGVSLGDETFEVMAVDDGNQTTTDGVLRFLAMPGGADPVEFRALKPPGTSSVTFESELHDDPKWISYGREATGQLHARVGSQPPLEFFFEPIAYVAAPELEAEDRKTPRKPYASGRRGDLGYTVGQNGRDSYARIHKRVDNAWTLVFETQRRAALRW